MREPVACPWPNRAAAGLELAQRLRRLGFAPPGTTVVGLARAGLAVAEALAGELGLPLARWSICRLTVPEQTGRGCGALAPGGVEVWDGKAARRLGLGTLGHDDLVARHHLALRARRAGDSPADALRGRPLLVVDDAIEGGATMAAALASLRRIGAGELRVAVPLARREGLERLSLAAHQLQVLRQLAPHERACRCYGGEPARGLEATSGAWIGAWIGAWTGADSASSSR